MKTWITEIQAYDPMDRCLKSWSGPTITADDFYSAMQYCQENGLGYCKVVGQLVGEVELGNVPFSMIETALNKKRSDLLIEYSNNKKYFIVAETTNGYYKLKVIIS